MNIRAYTESDLEPIMDLSVTAWERVMPLMFEDYLPGVIEAFYPKGWEVAQRDGAKATVTDPEVMTFVAEEDGEIVGFAASKLHHEDTMGEIYMIATHPDHQGEGIGQALIHHAENWMKEKGMKIVLIETGADEGHAPARAAYEKSGYSLTPIARYFKEL